MYITEYGFLDVFQLYIFIEQTKNIKKGPFLATHFYTTNTHTHTRTLTLSSRFQIGGAESLEQFCECFVIFDSRFMTKRFLKNYTIYKEGGT